MVQKSGNGTLKHVNSDTLVLHFAIIFTASELILESIEEKISKLQIHCGNNDYQQYLHFKCKLVFLKYLKWQKISCTFCLLFCAL